MLDWLRLTRASGLFTVASNVLAAVAAAVYTEDLALHILGQELYRHAGTVVWVLIASSLFLLVGMLWNDVADVERDRVLHPRRPLPAGRIQLSTAWLAGLLMSSGALLAAAQAGFYGLCMGGVVLTLILIYSFLTKEIPWLGSLTMALVRGSHALFALLIIDPVYFETSALALLSVFTPVSAPVRVDVPIYPLLLTAYIFGVTLISELESRRGHRWELLLGGLVLALTVVFALRLGLDAHWIRELGLRQATVQRIGAILLVLLLTGVIVWRLGRPYLEALRTARRRHVGPVVGRGLGGIILFDALIAAAFHPLMGLAALLLFIPSRLSRRLISME